MSTEPAPTFRRYDLAWLESNDCFGSKEAVTVVTVHKAGTVKLLAVDGRTITNHVKNLTPRKE